MHQTFPSNSGLFLGHAWVCPCPAFEASLLYIFRNGIAIIGEKPAVSHMQSFAKTLVHMGHVQYNEDCHSC